MFSCTPLERHLCEKLFIVLCPIYILKSNRPYQRTWIELVMLVAGSIRVNFSSTHREDDFISPCGASII